MQLQEKLNELTMHLIILNKLISDLEYTRTVSKSRPVDVSLEALQVMKVRLYLSNMSDCLTDTVELLTSFFDVEEDSEDEQ